MVKITHFSSAEVRTTRPVAAAAAANVDAFLGGMIAATFARLPELMRREAR